jgi:hypothetical protein
MTTLSSKIEVLHLLRAWDKILREFGCSKEQIRELYWISREDGLRSSDDLDISQLSLELEAEDEARDLWDQLQN